MIIAQEDNHEGQQQEADHDSVGKDPTSAEGVQVESPIVEAPSTKEAAPPDQALESTPDEPKRDESLPPSAENQCEEGQSRAEPVASSSAPTVTDAAEASPAIVNQGDSSSVEPVHPVEATAVETQPRSVAATEEETERTPQEEPPLQGEFPIPSTDNTAVLPQQDTWIAEQTPQGAGPSEVVTPAATQSEECPPPYVEPSASSALPEATDELHTGLEEPAQDESSPPEDANHVDEDDAVLTPQQSSGSLTTKPPGFLESLTANFAPDTKAMWAQIFGPRYDEGDEDGQLQADNQSSNNSPRDSVSSKSSLQAKLDRGRKLDEQIQASQRRYRDRVLRTAAANNTTSRPSQAKASRRPRNQTPTISPFEQAGLSLTQIRFCTEKAIDETCKCFRHLHAIALDEAEESTNPSGQGVFVTQWELDHLLRESFDPQEVTTSSSRGRKGTLAAPLNFEQSRSGAFVEGIALNTQLQASWFIPFGQLPQLRSLVMKITKRHLNEDKLAIVNRHLQRQLTMLPLSLRLQNLVVQLSNQKLKEPIDVPVRQRLQSPEELAQDLLGCLEVDGAAMSTEGPEDYKNFLLFLPVELVAKTQLSSVICAQRLVFFRFLIEIIAAERSRLQSKSTESLPPALPEQIQTKRKSLTGKRTRSSSGTIPVELGSESEVTPQESEKPAEREDSASLQAAHGSLPSPAEAEADDKPGECDPFQHSPETELAGDECEKPASQLQQQLESAIAQLRRRLPTIDSDVDPDVKIYALNPAIQATHLAAVACHQSVLLMIENNINVDAAMSNKLRHFIESLQAIQSQSHDQQLVAPASIQLEAEKTDHQPLDAPRFPPPYPESTAPEESADGERSTVQARYPPPYVITTPSYWTFTPSIPEPKSSIAKLANKSPSNKSADLRSNFMSKESPGVGAYDIQQGDKLTFQQRPSYSFGSTVGDASVGGGASESSLPKGSTGKPGARSFRQRMKTSLAFVRPMLHPEEDSEVSTDTRVHVASQYDDNHLRASANHDFLDDLPPHYNEGDANEAPEEKPGHEAADLSVETDMDKALRLQQRIFMNEFVQHVVSNQESPSYFVPRVKRSTETQSSRQSKSKPKPYWATSEVSPGIERLLQRQRRAPKSRPGPASSDPVQPRASKRVVKKPAASPPPRRELDNDQHLAWAARISELYQPAVE